MLRPGDTTATGQRMGKDCSALAVLREAVRRSDFHRKRKAKRGIGLALFFHGSGFTGSGEVRLKSKAALELTKNGARVLVASTEIGQGTRTMHAQIVADTLGIPFEDVEVAVPDTAGVPDSGPTVASRTCMVVGRILERCAAEMKERLGGLPPGEYHRRHGALTITREYEPPPGIAWDEERYRGDAYATYAWACDVAEVELDRDTFEVKAKRMTLVQEFGRPIHPVMARGQIEGGTAQGVGFALLEHVATQDGALLWVVRTIATAPCAWDRVQANVMVRCGGHWRAGAEEGVVPLSVEPSGREHGWPCRWLQEYHAVLDPDVKRVIDREGIELITYARVE